MASDAAASTPKHKKKYTHQKMKTRLRVTKVNLMKDEQYERPTFTAHATNAGLYLILRKKTNILISVLVTISPLTWFVRGSIK